MKSLKYNFVMNSILTLSSVLFPLITFPYISRVLSPDGLGRVYFSNSVISYFSIIAQLGIPVYGIRACARVRENKEELSKTVHEIFIVNLITTFIAYTLLCIFLLVIPRLNEDSTIIIVASFSMIFNTIGMEWLYKGLEQYDYIAVRFVAAKFIAFVLVFVFVKRLSDSIAYCAISVFAGGASFIFNFIHARKYISFKIQKNYNIKKHLRNIVIFFAMACAATVSTNFDNLMLGFMKTNDVVGYYNAAIKIKTILTSIVTSLGAVILPRASYFVEKKQFTDFYFVSRKAMSFIVTFSIPLVIFFILFSENAILLLSGEEYLPSIFPMKVIMPTLLFVGMSNIIGYQIMIPLGCEKKVLYAQLFGTLINVVINVFLIPSFSTIGASIGTLIAEISIFTYLYRKVRAFDKDLFMLVHFKSIAFATALASLASYSIKMLHISSNILILIVSGLMYFSVYLLMLYFLKDPIINDTVIKVKERVVSIIWNQKNNRSKSNGGK